MSRPPLLIEARRRLSVWEKSVVLERQLWLCGCGCGEKLDGAIEYDHAVALSFGGTNALDNFVALKPRHHLAKTSAEATRRAKADRQGGRGASQWAKRKDGKTRGFTFWRGLSRPDLRRKPLPWERPHA